MIGSVSTEPQAERFSAYLLTANIDSHIEESSGGQWQVWIEHDDDLDKGKAELEQFRANPDDTRYTVATTAAAKLRKEQEKAADRRRKNYTDVRSGWSGTKRRAVPATIVLVLACVVIAMFTTTNPAAREKLYFALLFDVTPPQATDLAEDGTLVRRGSMFDDIGRGQVWRLATPMLLHDGIIHLLFNMMWLWRFGQVIEGAKGTLFFIGLVVVIAALSCATQALWYELMPDWHIFLGMSGVNAGLLGYAWMKRKFQPYEQIHVTDQEIGLMIGWLVICSIGLVANIANAAHWGGLVIGLVIGVLPTLWRKLRAR